MALKAILQVWEAWGRLYLGAIGPLQGVSIGAPLRGSSKNCQGFSGFLYDFPRGALSKIYRGLEFRVFGALLGFL